MNKNFGAAAIGFTIALSSLVLSAHIPYAQAAPVMPALKAVETNSRVPGVDVAYDEWTDTQRNRTLPVKIYMPQNLRPSLPVIMGLRGIVWVNLPDLPSRLVA